ncbi:MAG: type II toxin-antitoxin system VapC family toxin [Chthoniobacterales bacterium]
MVICAGTSFLFSLYGNDINTPHAIKWVKKHRTVLTLTTLNEYELGNALRFAEFRKVLVRGEASIFWAQFEADKTAGRLVTKICNLAEVIDEAKRLSATYTLTEGHRGFDILHVAAAIKQNAKQFLTFDSNQKKMAKAENLTVPL